MIVVLVGASGTGKDSVARELVQNYGFEMVISFTTRKPREGEIDGVDYHFVSQDTFSLMKKQNQFIEVDAYSGERWYGSCYKDYFLGGEKVVKILTPNGVRQLIKNGIRDKFFVVYLHSPLAVECKRYIDRAGKDFTIDELMELTRRKIADAEMFRWMPEEADLCIENNATTKIEEIAKLIMYELDNVGGI